MTLVDLLHERKNITCIKLFLASKEINPARRVLLSDMMKRIDGVLDVAFKHLPKEGEL